VCFAVGLIIPILKIRTWKPREAEGFAQSHIADPVEQGRRDGRLCSEAGPHRQAVAPGEGQAIHLALFHRYFSV
jgi:hypothetical protein